MDCTDIRDRLPRFSGFPWEIFQQLVTQCRCLATVVERLDLCGSVLVQWILEQPPPQFLLPQVLDFIDQVNQHNLVDPLRYQMASFEGWLVRRSGLSQSQQRLARGLVAGAFIPRASYQYAFPIGKAEHLPGSHIVAAHSSPDLDTVTASFWTWMDAWAAEIGDGLHHWNVPGGVPQLVEVGLFWIETLGAGLHRLPKKRSALRLNAYDLISRNLPVRTLGLSDTLKQISPYEPPVAILGESGHVIGELHMQDIEAIRRVTVPLTQCVSWIIRKIDATLIDHFAHNRSVNNLSTVLERIFVLPLASADPISYIGPQEIEEINKLLKIAFGAAAGLNSSFQYLVDLFNQEDASLAELYQTIKNAHKLKTQSSAELFQLAANYSNYLQKLLDILRERLESVEIGLLVKEQILQRPHLIVSSGADLEELQRLRSDGQALLVTLSDSQHCQHAQGLVLDEHLVRMPAGTVSLCDFSNRQETAIPEYLAIVAALDHHKIHLQTQAPPTITIADVQSANTLLCENMQTIHLPFFYQHDCEKLKTQLHALHTKDSAADLRRQQQLLQQLKAAQSSWWVSSERLICQALHMLLAILDDTDQLAKLSWRDVDAVHILLQLLQELLYSHGDAGLIDSLERSPENIERARAELLQMPLMQALMGEVMQGKEADLKENLIRCADGNESNIFRDLKIQNGYAAISQLKLYPSTLELFNQLAPQIMQQWHSLALAIAKQRPEVDLYMHMISTVSEDSVELQHTDQLWLWTMAPDLSQPNLRVFLGNLWASALRMEHSKCYITLLGPDSPSLERLIGESMPGIVIKHSQEELPYSMAVLYFPAGKLNSRKASITPNLARVRL